MNFFEKQFKRIPVNARFAVFVALAFAAFISFAQINSAGADKHHTNGLFYVLGFLFSAAVLMIIKIAIGENKK
jgi:hypothetical protein